MKQVFRERGEDRRADPALGALIDLAIAYRQNLGVRVAQAFLGEVRVPEAAARRVLDGSACQRSPVPRRRPGDAADRALAAADQARTAEP